MLRQRLATAAVGIPIVVVLVLAGGPAFDVALMLVIAGGVLELAHAAGVCWRRPEALIVAALSAALVPATYGHRDVQSGILAAAVARGASVAAAAQLGDLAEAALKRRLGVKDMGRLLPGRGGPMDRLDSILFAAPVLYFFVRWLIS